MLLKECARCRKIIPYGNSYCPACKLQADAEREAYFKAQRKKYDRKRNKEHIQFYNSKEWRALSAYYMNSTHYLCEKCGAPAVEVHHIQPIQTAEGWKRRLDCKNLVALCHKCHDKEHGRFQKRTNGGG